jgi:hypothetical protein
VKFECTEVRPPENPYVYWYGSLDDTPKTSKMGKPYTQLQITKNTLKTLGYSGEDVLGFIEDNALSTQEHFEITVEEFSTATGDKIPTVRRIRSVERPESNTGSEGPKKLSKAEVAAKLAASMKVQAMAKGTTQKAVVNSSSTEDFPF